jgi:hypothetical protein
MFGITTMKAPKSSEGKSQHAGTIAERSVDLLTPSGERIALLVEFGPIRKSGQGFRCRVRYHGGWEDSPPDIGGHDSLEALLLAVDLVHAMFVDFARDGVRVLWPGTSNDYDLSAFLPHGPKAEPAAPTDCRPARTKTARKPRQDRGR